MKAYLRSSFAQTISVIVFSVIFAESMPEHIARSFYTISSILKDLLMLFLPFAICMFITSTLLHFKRQGGLLLLMLVMFEIVSNSFASISAYGLSYIGAPFYEGVSLNATTQSLKPYIVLPSPPVFWRVEYATIVGVICGILIPFAAHSPSLMRWAQSLNYWVQNGKNVCLFVFSRVFTKVIPLFILGFFVNLVRTADFARMISNGGYAGLIMIVGLALYLGFLFWLSSGCSITRAWVHFKNALPAGITALSSMSSAATMPMTIQAAEKNLKQPEFAGMVIPATTNIQQIGDCFINVFICCVMLAFFGKGIPSLATFFTFLGVFVLARFTTSAVIGGAIFIMLPLYQHYLNFTPEMISIIFTFNMILDPLVTSSNVLGNIALCTLFERVWIKLMAKINAPKAT